MCAFVSSVFALTCQCLLQETVRGGPIGRIAPWAASSYDPRRANSTSSRGGSTLSVMVAGSRGRIGRASRSCDSQVGQCRRIRRSRNTRLCNRPPCHHASPTLHSNPSGGHCGATIGSSVQVLDLLLFCKGILDSMSSSKIECAKFQTWQSDLPRARVANL